ncbi:MAG: bifunctional transaldolase/phosoglucose isomerase [Desulfatiglandales bacterium]
MTKIHDLAKLGQSVWYDYIRRSFIVSGELQILIDKGLRGITSNPSIFEKAIAGSSDYDEDLISLSERDKTPEEIYEALVFRDIAMAADLLRPVYEETGGADGYVSLEVNPKLANDTQKTVAEAKRLFEALDRPNIMIKVPATPAGIPAIAKLTGMGVNVNVTLLFSIEIYKRVAEAYIRGLEELSSSGPSVTGAHPVDRIASVASFFLSRVDTAVDRALEAVGIRELQGRIAIANAKLAYAEFQSIFSGRAWERLAARGARVQRLLWASTGSKNPLYPDTLYVDRLIGPDTVNTMPPATLNSFLDHGRISPSLTQGLEEATTQLRQLSDLGINLEGIAMHLLDEGIEAFTEPFNALMSSISEKRRCLREGKSRWSADLGAYREKVEDALNRMREQKTMHRIWRHDYTVWKEEPREITNRLGWLHGPEIMKEAVPQITAFVEDIRAEGHTSALLLGMGGSSLAPEMFRQVFGVKKGYPDLSVLDSTDPGAVLELKRRLDPHRTLYIVSTKSGGTVETLSFMKFFYNAAAEALGSEKAGNHFIAITDPGSSLEATAEDLGFRRVFLNDPNIGGRYSALSYFGLVPAALVGVDLYRLIDRAARMACNNEGCNCPLSGDNTGARLGAVMGELALMGRDKITLITSPPLGPFGNWAEQLIAESTGKEGKGILPVEGERLLKPEYYSDDRLFVYLKLEGDDTCDTGVKALEESGHPVVRILLGDLYDLGGELFRWEMATAVAGSILEINPFDQPNVESAKVLALQMVAAYRLEGQLPELKPLFKSDGISVFAETQARDIEEVLKTFLDQADKGETGGRGRGYIALQAYLKPDEAVLVALQDLREALQKKYRMATTLGCGPRFLHSTGQLHKGDAGEGLFIQITGEMPEDAGIPDEPGREEASLSFGTLKSAQALGDRQALMDAGRRVIRFHLEGDAAEGIDRLRKAVF